ncbi:MAG: SCP2 sterol-binding domain-containing protein [Gammaproteobacteria bacterium]|jgi:O2-independent ubiquinone biosynthesis accessory factor UbiT|nr:SCP2 sterol-binding domain-containing protein [Gammaproteobacteria bacterium]MBU0772490.1 SCP2 sterol-binding domain-containing protein [Gammaproteobacteria bacterium]MBU0855035.1 SCP2 sterol-binding domain-containing protein [Gammaproteobacteria bacterium]MBU1847224.1 SCP2 sterol-binding domain-containing protein [Gammaproteobacteria bacterium]
MTPSATPSHRVLPPLPPVLRELVARLPVHPPSHLLALALERVLRPRLPADAAARLAGHAVDIEVRDFGLRCRVTLRDGHFRSAPASGPATLRIAADAASYLRLLRGDDDADRLFFERALVMEGDTEYGLLLKNTLDAIGPLLHWPLRRA